jgi:hypothetical protein
LQERSDIQTHIKTVSGFKIAEICKQARHSKVSKQGSGRNCWGTDTTLEDGKDGMSAISILGFDVRLAREAGRERRRTPAFAIRADVKHCLHFSFVFSAPLPCPIRVGTLNVFFERLIVFVPLIQRDVANHRLVCPTIVHQKISMLYTMDKSFFSTWRIKRLIEGHQLVCHRLKID